MDNRNRTLDIVKGIGICLVVLGHIQNPSQTYIYGFHMPLFFILSGSFLKEKSLANPGRYIKSRFRRLLMPFVLINVFAFFVFPHEEAFWWRMFGIVSAIDYPHSMLGAVWFLKSLFVVSLLVFFTIFILKFLLSYKQIHEYWFLPCTFLTFAIISDYFTGPKVSSWFFQCVFFSLGICVKDYINVICEEFKFSWKKLLIMTMGGVFS